MATMQLTSTNADWSFALKKNPNSGLIVRTLRQGLVFGWYDNPRTYNILFKENSDTLSFTQENNYLDITQFGSTYPTFQCIALLFNHLLSKDAIKVDGTFTVKVPCVLAKEVRLKYLSSFLDLNIQCHELKQGISSFYCEYTGFLHEFLMKLFVLFYLDQATGFNGIIFLPELTKKAVRIMKELDVPYMLRYHVSKTAIKSQAMFHEMKAELESSETQDICMCFGNTQIQRERHIEKLFNFDKSIVDIGCGEGNYSIPYATKLRNKCNVHAIDIDSSSLALVGDKANEKELSNLRTYPHLTEFLKDYDKTLVDVLLTEVIEHMPLEFASELINDILTHINFETLVITTPNAEFNQFYRLNGFRHLDHCWEMTANEFKDYMTSLLKPHTHLTDIKFIDIGDKVNGIATSQGVVITAHRK